MQRIFILEITKSGCNNVTVLDDSIINYTTSEDKVSSITGTELRVALVGSYNRKAPRTNKLNSLNTRAQNSIIKCVNSVTCV